VGFKSDELGKDYKKLILMAEYKGSGACSSSVGVVREEVRRKFKLGRIVWRHVLMRWRGEF